MAGAGALEHRDAAVPLGETRGKRLGTRTSCFSDWIKTDYFHDSFYL